MITKTDTYLNSEEHFNKATDSETRLAILVEYRKHLISAKKKEGHTTTQGYLSIKIDDNWITEHRAIWEREYGPIPKGSAIWHINGQNMDNRLRNLVSLKRSERGILFILRAQRITELERENRTLKDKVAVLENKSFEEIVNNLEK